MKHLIVCAALVAAASASGPKQAPGPTLNDQPHGPSEAETNAILTRLQREVNYKALRLGSGIGTASHYGVPRAENKADRAHHTPAYHAGYYGYAPYYQRYYGYGGYPVGYPYYALGYNYGGYYGGYPGFY